MAKLSSKVLEAWKNREAELMSVGTSRYQAHLTIGREPIVKGASRSKIYYWLTESIREWSIKNALNYSHNIADKEKLRKYGRNRRRLFIDFKWFLFNYLEIGKEYPTEDIRQRIKTKTGMKISINVLEQKLNYLKRGKNNPVVEIKQGLYKLNNEYYRNNKIKTVFLE